MADFFPPEVKVDGMRCADGLVELWGIASRQPNGRYRCHANAFGSWCIVEVRLYDLPATPGEGAK